jgi:hypothetical protein
LTGAQRLRFRAWSSRDGTRAKFFVGGVNSGKYPGSIAPARLVQGADATGFVVLGSEPKEYVVDLRDADLSKVIGGFGFATTRCESAEPVEFYLDDIVYDSTEPRTVVSGNEEIFPVLVGTSPRHGFGFGVDSENKKREWVQNQCDSLKMMFPAGEDWGVVYVHVGDSPMLRGWRDSIDLRAFPTLAFDLKGESGSETVRVSIKDDTDPDSGVEEKILLKATANWMRCRIPVSKISTADPARVYVPIEFVFDGEDGPQTVSVRNVHYLKKSVMRVLCN